MIPEFFSFTSRDGQLTVRFHREPAFPPYTFTARVCVEARSEPSDRTVCRAVPVYRTIPNYKVTSLADDVRSAWLKVIDRIRELPESDSVGMAISLQEASEALPF